MKITFVLTHRNTNLFICISICKIGKNFPQRLNIFHTFKSIIAPEDNETPMPAGEISERLNYRYSDPEMDCISCKGNR